MVAAIARLGSGEACSRMIRGFSIGAELDMRDLRRLMTDPFVVDKTDVSTFLEGTLLVVALTDGVKTTMLWKLHRGHKKVVLEKLWRKSFKCVGRGARR